MISRQWCGVARNADADRYVAYLRTETFPALSRIAGFIGASILRRSVPKGVEFRIDDGDLRSDCRALRGCR